MIEGILAPPRASLGVDRSAVTGVLATLVLFVLCWALVGIGLPVSHTFVSLFTPEPVGSAAALWTGGLHAIVFGGVAGALIACCYNLAGRMLGH